MSRSEGHDEEEGQNTLVSQHTLAWQRKLEELEQQSIKKENMEKTFAFFVILAQHVEHDELRPIGFWRPGPPQ
jgi:hypothetical protein